MYVGFGWVEFSCFCPFFVLSVGGSCLNLLGLLAAIGPFQRCLGRRFTRFKCGGVENVSDTNNFMFWNVGLFLFLFIFYRLTTISNKVPWFSTVKAYNHKFSKFFAKNCLEVMLSLGVLFIRYHFPNH